MINVYKDNDALLKDYNSLTQEHQNKAGKYIKNLIRLEKAEAGIKWSEKEIERKLEKLNVEPECDPKVYCNFCGKSQDEAKIIIAGPNEVYICDECAGICNEILEHEK